MRGGPDKKKKTGTFSLKKRRNGSQSPQGKRGMDQEGRKLGEVAKFKKKMKFWRGWKKGETKKRRQKHNSVVLSEVVRGKLEKVGDTILNPNGKKKKLGNGG